MEILIKQKAIDILIKLGYLIPFNNVEAYHGRASKPNENWSVIPNYVSKNFKYGVPLLCTGTKETAQNFAEVNADKTKNAEPKVYKIVSNKKDALLINRNFEADKLNENDSKLYFDSLFALGSLSLSKLAPPPFEFRDKFMIVIKSIADYVVESGQSIITFDDAYMLYEMLDIENMGMSNTYFTEIVGIMNTKVLSKINPNYLLFRYSIESDDVRKNEIYFDEMGNFVEYYERSLFRAPFSRKYFENYLNENNIIGFKFDVDSFIIGREMNSYILFASEDVFTEKDLKIKKANEEKEFFELANLFSSLNIDKNLLQQISDSEPESIIEALSKIPGVKTLLDKDAGNWEGFSIGEHTESVLRVYQNSFEYNISPKVSPYIKLLITLHDIGKGVSYEKYETYMQSNYNIHYADKILKDLNIDEKFIELVNFVIGKSQTYTTNYFVRMHSASEFELLNACRNTLKSVFGEKITQKEVLQLAKICVILQTCDSGAYTPYGTTRDRVSNEYYKNGNEHFAQSFKTPTDFFGKKLRFKFNDGKLSSENNIQNLQIGDNN